jgi:DeoR family transcriptional regulator, suf operon transcriptional repressor
MKSTRDRILQRLLAHPFSSINDLAQAVGINAISVRHHLTSLQADGLVAAQEERHGVGRPRLVYFLTDGGRERFPTRYLELTNRIINQLKDRFPEHTVHDIFNEIALELTEEKVSKLNGIPMEEKLDQLQQFLLDEGFSMHWEKKGDAYFIHQVSCPYYHVTQKHPEVCQLGRSIINQFLSLPVEKITCISQGNAHCTFQIPKNS